MNKIAMLSLVSVFFSGCAEGQENDAQVGEPDVENLSAASSECQRNFGECLRHCVDSQCFSRCNEELKQCTSSPRVADSSEENVGEAQEPWTRAQCQNAFVACYTSCYFPPWTPETLGMCRQLCENVLRTCITEP